MSISDEALKKSAKKKIEALGKAATQAYDLSQYMRSAEIRKEMLEIALSIDDKPTIGVNRFWYGACLSSLGRKRLALSAVSPILQDNSSDQDSINLYRAQIIYLDIAIDLPLRLNSLNKTIQQISYSLRDNGKKDRQSALLYLKAKLSLFRGIYREAFEVAQESWVCHLEDLTRFWATHHLDLLFESSIHLNHLDVAEKYLREWERINDVENLIFSEIIYLCRCSDFERLKNKYSEAIDYGRQAILKAEQTDDHEGVSAAKISLLRSLLCLGDTRNAHQSLLQLIEKRHSENRHIVYKVFLLIGDYHLAEARNHAGMMPQDDEYGEDFPPPQQIRNKALTTRSLHQADLSYRRAYKVGSDIDEKLQCNIRREEIAKRRDRVNDIRALL